jgi:hypothetical protein
MTNVLSIATLVCLKACKLLTPDNSLVAGVHITVVWFHMSHAYVSLNNRQWTKYLVFREYVDLAVRDVNRFKFAADLISLSSKLSKLSVCVLHGALLV